MKNFFDQKRVANKRGKKKVFGYKKFIIYIAATSLYIILLTKETKKIKEKCIKVIYWFYTDGTGTEEQEQEPVNGAQYSILSLLKYTRQLNFTVSWLFLAYIQALFPIWSRLLIVLPASATFTVNLTGNR